MRLDGDQISAEADDGDAGHTSVAYIPGPPCWDVSLVGGGVSRAYSIRVGGGALSFSEAIKTCFQKFAEFRGWASRPEFWWFALVYYLVIFAPVVAFLFISQDSNSFNQATFDNQGTNGTGLVFGLILSAAVLAMLIPYLAVGTRRLHDPGKPGWWWFITLVPFGSIILIVFWASEGDKGSNQYGPPPGVQAVQPPGSLPPPPPHLLRSKAGGSFQLAGASRPRMAA
jgi:uncharacterized membrane protein YhaH (DUF805 family)